MKIINYKVAPKLSDNGGALRGCELRKRCFSASSKRYAKDRI